MEDEMALDKQPTKKVFQPLEIIGIFWVVFGVIVLFATFFVKATPQVPRLHGIVTNIIAGLLLLAVGLACVIKGRANKRKKH